jgi:hypothetical protein
MDKVLDGATSYGLGALLTSIDLTALANGGD